MTEPYVPIHCALCLATLHSVSGLRLHLQWRHGLEPGEAYHRSNEERSRGAPRARR